MKIKRVLIVFIVFGFIMTNVSYALTLEARLKPNEHITFFFRGMEFVRLKNTGSTDATIKETVLINALTEVGYAVGFRENGELKNINHTMLLAPTDSLVFGKNGHQIYLLNRRNEAVFLDASIETGYSLLSEARRLKIFTL